MVCSLLSSLLFLSVTVKAEHPAMTCPRLFMLETGAMDNSMEFTPIPSESHVFLVSCCSGTRGDSAWCWESCWGWIELVGTWEFLGSLAQDTSISPQLSSLSYQAGNHSTTGAASSRLPLSQGEAFQGTQGSSSPGWSLLKAQPQETEGTWLSQTGDFCQLRVVPELQMESWDGTAPVTPQACRTENIQYQGTREKKLFI